jgi:hypothetical protein
MKLEKYIQELIDKVDSADNGMLDGEQIIVNCLGYALEDNKEEFRRHLDYLIEHIQEL